MAFATVTSLAGLALLAGVGVALGQTLLLPPLAASMSLVAGAAATPLGQPRNVIGGQLASALTGFLVLYVGGRGVWSAVVAGGLALGVMLALRVSHSPAVATAVIVTVSGPPFGAFMALLALACVLLVGVGLLANRAGRRNYPLYWW
ncbi:HPP family protein [Streptomyces sp. HNM0574]|nr:HPP family protein [Streptomyces sp. HNM0574]